MYHFILYSFFAYGFMIIFGTIFCVVPITIVWLYQSARDNPVPAITLLGFLAFMLLSALTPPSPPRPWPQPTYQQQLIMPFSQRWAFTEQHQ
jgi:hypothetical protein